MTFGKSRRCTVSLGRDPGQLKKQTSLAEMRPRISVSMRSLFSLKGFTGKDTVHICISTNMYLSCGVLYIVLYIWGQVVLVCMSHSALKSIIIIIYIERCL